MVLNWVKEIFFDYFGIEEDEFSLEASLKADCGLDELDMVDLSMDIEDTFEFEVTDEAVEELITVGDLVKYIEANK